MVERAMESCAFKAALACVGGAAGAVEGAGGGWRDGALRGSGGRGSQLWGRLVGWSPWRRERGGSRRSCSSGPPPPHPVCSFPPSKPSPVSVTGPRGASLSVCLPRKGRGAHSLSSAQHRLSARRASAAASVASRHRPVVLLPCPLHAAALADSGSKGALVPVRNVLLESSQGSFYTVCLLQGLFWEVHLVSSQLASTPTLGLIPRIRIAHQLQKRSSKIWGSEAYPTQRTSPLWVPCSPAPNVW